MEVELACAETQRNLGTKNFNSPAPPGVSVPFLEVRIRYSIHRILYCIIFCRILRRIAIASSLVSALHPSSHRRRIAIASS